MEIEIYHLHLILVVEEGFETPREMNLNSHYYGLIENLTFVEEVGKMEALVVWEGLDQLTGGRMPKGSLEHSLGLSLEHSLGLVEVESCLQLVLVDFLALQPSQMMELPPLV